MLTLDDISEARREDIEALELTQYNGARTVLIALANELDEFERAHDNNGLEWDHGHIAARQMWKAAYEAAGGVIIHET